MRFTNPIHFGALALTIIPAVSATKFTFMIPMGLSHFVEYNRIIEKWDTKSNKFELNYLDRTTAAYNEHMWCFDKSSSTFWEPGVPMQQNSTDNCKNLPSYWNIAEISFESPADEPQTIVINMPEYKLFCNMTFQDVSEDRFQWYVDLGVWASKEDGIPNLDKFNIVCRRSRNAIKIA